MIYGSGVGSGDDKTRLLKLPSFILFRTYWNASSEWTECKVWKSLKFCMADVNNHDSVSVINLATPTASIFKKRISTFRAPQKPAEGHLVQNVRRAEWLLAPVSLDQVDDVLKSVVVYDDAGQVGQVRLPGHEPLAHRDRTPKE